MVAADDAQLSPAVTKRVIRRSRSCRETGADGPPT
jgi:hypothetical protein